MTDLRNYHFKNIEGKKWGTSRGSDQMAGGDLYFKVPMGTEVRELDSGELICELLDHEQEVLLLEGRKVVVVTHIQSSINQLPSIYRG